MVRPKGLRQCYHGLLVNVSPIFHLERKSSDRKTFRRYKTGNWGLTQEFAPSAESKGRIFEIGCKNVLISTCFTV